MKQILPAALCLTLALPATAQETEEPGIRDGFGLLSEGSRLILEGLVDEMRPVFEEQMLPLLQDLSGMIDDLSAYHAPEMLPNGDILIRRRTDPKDAPEDAPEAGEEPTTEPVDL